jgi:hypothetical protein
MESDIVLVIVIVERKRGTSCCREFVGYSVGCEDHPCSWVGNEGRERERERYAS